MTFEEALKSVIDTGRFAHLTLAFSEGNNMWQGSYREKGATGYRIEFHSDPIGALTAALNETITTTTYVPAFTHPPKPEPTALPAPDESEDEDLIG